MSAASALKETAGLTPGEAARRASLNRCDQFRLLDTAVPVAKEYDVFAEATSNDLP